MRVDGISCRSQVTGNVVQPLKQPPSEHTDETIDGLLNDLKCATAKLRSTDKSNVNQGRADDSVIVKKLFKLLDEVYGLLTKKSFAHSNNKLKGKLMQALLQVAALRNPRMHIKVVDLGILLGLKDASQVKISKIIYRVAKDAKNDEFFLQDKNFAGLIVRLLSGFGLDSALALENLGTTSMITTLESLLYTCGALKFLTASAITREALCTPELLHVLGDIHRALDSYDCTWDQSSDGDRDDSLRKTVHHVLLQITEIFCIASATKTSDKLKMCLVETGVINVVLKSLSRRSVLPPPAIPNSADFRQILLNWSRTIAHATEHSFVCRLLGEKDYSFHCTDLVALILLHKNQVDFVLRLTYALGNIAAHCRNAGKTILASKESIAKICTLCEEYAAAPLDAEPNSPTYDLLSKLTRVIANSCVGAEGGLLAANTPECASMLLGLLRASTTTEPTNDELLNNALAGLNNITFYMTSKTDAELLSLQTDVGQECIQLLNKFSRVEEISLNIVRVLGNLTRFTVIRAAIVDTISSNLDDPWLIDRFWSLLESSDEIVYSTLGVLVNLMQEPTFLAVFRQRDGFQKMVDIMTAYAGLNWQTAALAGKVMCNFIVSDVCTSDEGGGGSLPLDPKISAKLEHLLCKLIDEEAVKQTYEDGATGISLADDDCGHSQIWKATWKEELLPVASHLLLLLTKISRCS